LRDTPLKRGILLLEYRNCKAILIFLKIFIFNLDKLYSNTKFLSLRRGRKGEGDNRGVSGDTSPEYLVVKQDSIS